MNGFVYEWVNLINGHWYIGSHEGDENDGYTGSGISFRAAIAKHGIENFKRKILYRGEEFRLEEERILVERDAAGDPNSYNHKNQALGVSLVGEKNGMFGKKLTPEEKYKCGGAFRGKKRPDHSKRMSGVGNPMFGVSRTGSFAIQKGVQTRKMNRGGWEFLMNEGHHSMPFRRIFRELLKGEFVKPRGQLIIELENYSYVLPPYVRFMNFKSRGFKLDYVKREMLWYIKGDRFDLSICKHAKMWDQIKNVDGSINSNYGQYIFGAINQFDQVVQTLKDDIDSRRASMTILDSGHLTTVTKDVPCTYALNFRIRQNRLNMSVHMRSQDAIFGMGNDVPAFSIIHEMLLNALRRYYPTLEYGTYHHIADSLHVYERHFEMLEKLAAKDSYKMVLCPRISGPDEVDFLRRLDYTNIPDEYAFTKWVTTFDTNVIS